MSENTTWTDEDERAFQGWCHERIQGLKYGRSRTALEVAKWATERARRETLGKMLESARLGVNGGFEEGRREERARIAAELRPVVEEMRRIAYRLGPYKAHELADRIARVLGEEA